MQKCLSNLFKIDPDLLWKLYNNQQLHNKRKMLREILNAVDVWLVNSTENEVIRKDSP